MSLYTDAHDAINSDFYIAANTQDRHTLDKFVTASWFPFTSLEAWLRNLPPYVIRDVERSIRNVENINRRMSRDLSTTIPKGYNGRSSVSHRKVRA